MFLLPEINLKLRPRLLELKPGTRVVSNTFTMGEWEADREVMTDDNWNSWNTALLWIVPAKVEGIWKMGQDELVLSQQFQDTAWQGQPWRKIDNNNRRETRWQRNYFQGRRSFVYGNVNGNKMLGTVTNQAKGNKSDWYATR